MNADRVFDELLKPVVEQFYTATKAAAELPAGVEFATARAFQLGRADALETVGDLIADKLGVALSLWENMREMALDGGR